MVTDDAASLEPLAGLITDELNVKSLVLTDLADADQGAFGVQQTLQVNARAAGPRLGRDVQKAIKGSKSGDWSVDARRVGGRGRNRSGGRGVRPDHGGGRRRSE